MIMLRCVFFVTKKTCTVGYKHIYIYMQDARYKMHHYCFLRKYTIVSSLCFEQYILLLSPIPNPAVVVHPSYIHIFSRKLHIPSNLWMEQKRATSDLYPKFAVTLHDSQRLHITLNISSVLCCLQNKTFPDSTPKLGDL